MRIRNWLPVIALAFATFVFNTSEFIPIGLLSSIAGDLQITEAKAGMLITIYAWVVAATSLPLMLAVSKMEYRKILFGILGLFIASHVLSAFAHTYTTLLISRIGVACSHAIFWSIVSPLAVKVAPDGHRSTALSIIIAGSSIAMIAGLPLGRAIGLYVGWRATFMCIAIAATAVLFILTLVFPKVSGNEAISLRELPRLFRNKALIGIYVTTLVLITAHFTGYSYIEPFLAQVAGFGENSITMILTIFGLVGIAGSILFSLYYDRKPNLFIVCAVTGIAAALLLLLPATIGKTAVITVCIFWGLAVSFYNIVFQSEIIRIVPQGTAVAMSAYSGIYNIGIGGGALVGGLVCTHLSINAIGYIGAAISILPLLFCLFRLIPTLNKTR